MPVLFKVVFLEGPVKLHEIPCKDLEIAVHHRAQPPDHDRGHRVPAVGVRVPERVGEPDCEMITHDVHEARRSELTIAIGEGGCVGGGIPSCSTGANKKRWRDILILLEKLDNALTLTDIPSIVIHETDHRHGHLGIILVQQRPEVANHSRVRRVDGALHDPSGVPVQKGGHDTT